MKAVVYPTQLNITMKNEETNVQTNNLIRMMTHVAMPRVCAIMASCASVPIAPKHMDTDAKKFSPPPSKANVYVMRSSSYGGAIAFQSTVDGVRLGGVVPKRYLMKSVDPGVHTLEVFSNENADMAQFHAVAGQNYFYDVNAKMGWVSARTKLKRLDENDGKAKVLRLTRAMSMSY